MFFYHLGDTSKKSSLKELEGAILRDISDFWKETSGDIAFYMKETFYHHFTKVLH